MFQNLRIIPIYTFNYYKEVIYLNRGERYAIWRTKRDA